MMLHLGPLQRDSKEVWVDGLGADGLGGGADAPGKNSYGTHNEAK